MAERARTRSVLCFVSLPSSLTYQFEVNPQDKAVVCLEKICGTLGIVEKDYFGLQYKRNGYRYWLNMRNEIGRQLKQSPPYKLDMRVKFFIEPVHIQQESTRSLFYMHLRYAVLNGDLVVPPDKQPHIGALIAQIENGSPLNRTTPMMYPQYFPNAEVGVYRRIGIEHQCYAGLSRSAAEVMILTELSRLDGYGCHKYPVRSLDSVQLILSIGNNCLSTFYADGGLAKRVSYGSLLEAAYKDKYFTVRYRALDDNNQHTPVCYSVKTNSHKLALSIFRMLTEDHTFFFHERVGDRVLNHQIARSWGEVFKSAVIPRLTVNKRHHFDIVRTKMESYSQAWELLHQLQNGSATQSSSAQNHLTPRRPPLLVRPQQLATTETASNNTNEDASTFDFHQEVDEYLRIGLSRSSTVLAKEILDNTDEKVGTAEGKKLESSDEELEANDPVLVKTSSATSVSVKLGGKFRQFLRKIEDSRLCKVCYDSEVSVVFCPCGHHVCCQRCAEICHRCPICRKHIAHIQTVFTM